MTVKESYPLTWPDGWPRTNKWATKSSKFKTKSFAVARDMLMDELRRFGARDIILSTNVPLRLDGLPYSGYRQPEDKGVAIFFTLKGKKMVFACDLWNKIEDNLYAIANTIDALRGIARWGSSELLERAFTGFTALPPAHSTKKHWSDVLGVSKEATVAYTYERFRTLLQANHPDRGGDTNRMAEINRAYDEFKQERNL